MIWFLIGAAIGCAHVVIGILKKTNKIGGMDHPVQSLVFGALGGALLGAVIYGTILWLLATYVF